MKNRAPADPVVPSASAQRAPRAPGIVAAVLTCCGLLLLSEPADATVITLQPGFSTGKDAQIADANLADVNFGSNQFLITNWPSNNRAVGLVEFDLSVIPTGSTINSASLELYHSLNQDLITNEFRYDVFRVTSAWEESSVTFNTAPTFDPSAVASITVDDGMRNVFRTWDVTSLVSGWVGGTLANHGFWVEEFPVAGIATLYFQSSDTSVPAQRPKLNIDFTAPVPAPAPSTVLLVGAGLVALVGRGRRKRY